MLAYHNDPKVKESVLAEMAMHRQADTLVQGYGYWQDGKGCAVGCLIHSSNHSEYETRFGIPRLLARLEDGIFEGLPVKEAKEWPERFLNAIVPGADLSMVFYHFMLWLLVDEIDGVIKYAKSKVAIKNVADLYLRKINGETIDKAQWLAAAYAYASADDDASASASAAAAYAAYAAYDAYASAAADASASAASAAAAYAAIRIKSRQQARIKQANKLIELLEKAQ